MTPPAGGAHSARGLWFSFALALAGAALVVYDLLGPQKGWTVLGMVLMMAGTLLLRKL
jgi:membrane-bound ClpP family serine protease